MLSLVPLPAFKDNYLWTLHDTHHALVVDPGDAAPVLAYLAAHQLTLVGILCTHHHHDHTGGIAELVAAYHCPVYAPRHEDIPCCTVAVGENDHIEITELGIRFNVLDIPGHTRGHVAYQWAGGVFCGDTLFGCGCGRLFEGTAAQLLHSLHRLSQLPDDTPIYCTHEYTAANIRFALACDPHNTALQQRQRDTQRLRDAGLPTLPSSVALEKSTNPFLRCTEPDIITRILQQTPLTAQDELSVFTAMRHWKNTF
jgi:hydroxyacylglutathione hydrolase